MDFAKLGFKAGLEIHQQLDTGKLFSRTPSLMRDDQPDITIQRTLRASAGESGEVDVAARAEQVKNKHYRYQAYADTISLIELDEEPIAPMERDALTVALQIALLTKAKVPDRIFVMRKTVVDGSNTSGFQRTALVGRDGTIEVNKAKISIPTICIEEDSAKVVKRTPEYDLYNLSRLGIPLVEIATGPDLQSPEQIKDVAAHIGMLLRSTGKAKRGLGTIRQDVNVSIAGGTRVEIKGAQDLRMLQLLAENEVRRQSALLEIRDELQKRKASVGKPIDVTALLAKSQSKIIKGNTVVALPLPGFTGLIGREVNPKRRLGTELSEYGKVGAGVSGAVHSDELPAYGITEEGKNLLESKLGDAFIFVADAKEKAESAIAIIAKRAKIAIKEIPGEVRRANPDATTSYLRPMPGSARMYPETDARSITPDLDIELPKLHTARAADYTKLGVGSDLVNALLRSGHHELFEELAESTSLKAPFIAETLVSYPRELRRLKAEPEKVSEQMLRDVFAALSEEKLARQSVFDALADAANSGKLNLDKFTLMSDDELKAELEKVIAQNKGAPQNALIGKAMAALRGKADGKKIVEMLKVLAK